MTSQGSQEAEESPSGPVSAGWALKCTNVLQSSQRRRRIDAPCRAEIASELSAYDAAYLELALRRSLTLVSLDARLIAAAGALGHPVLSATSDTRN